MIGWLWRWGPALAAMAAIFLASSIPDVGPLPADMSDKTAHFIAYAILGVLVIRAVSGARWSGCTAAAGWTAWAVTAAYGGSDEWHQFFVPGRTPSVLDVAADAAGAALGVLAVVGVARARPAGRRAV
jgi:VanZ family protein